MTLSIVSLKEKILEYKFPIVILALNVLVFWHKNLFDFLFVENLAGLDLVGNYSYTWLMGQFIENLSFNGWTNLWFAGTPTFDYYPPLFFIFTNLLNVVFLEMVPLKTWFKLVVFGSLFLLPLLIYYSSRKMQFKKLESFFVGVFSLGFIFLVGHFAAYYQTLNFGLVSQMLSIDIFILFLGSIFDIKTRKGKIISGVLLGLVILSHLFIGFLALITIFIILALDHGNWKKYMLVSFIGLLIAGPWLFNAIYHSSWFQVYTSKPGSFWDFPMIFVPFIIAGIKKDKRIITLLSLFLINLIIGLINLPLPLQHARYFQYALLFGFFLTGLGAFRIYDLLSNQLSIGKFLKGIFILIILIPFLFTIINKPTYRQYRSDTDIDNLINWIKVNVKEGRILTESDKSLNKDYYKLMEIIPRKTRRNTLNGLHVDASLSSHYTLALQYWISSDPKINPICDICKKTGTVDKDLILERMKRFNINYIIITKNSTRNYLKSFLEEVGNIDKFTLFSPRNHYECYEILDYKPILIVSKLEDWKDINRKLFSDNTIGNLTFVWASKKPGNTDKFSDIFIKSKEENTEKFYNRIKNNHTVKKIEGSNVKSLSIRKDNIEIKMKSEKPTPILLKFSYNPKWKVVGKSEKYLSNYGLLFIYIRGDTFLRY
ncbi:MAG: hypothetical protein ABEK36_02065 [Candidatus Aenigmatarchaeota archaeon]